LRDEYGLDEDELTAIRSEVDEQLGAIEQAALAAPFPEPADRSEFAGEQ
jgi:hypothetical protein